MSTNSLLKEVTLWAPAKLNLALSVLRKRPDGYHDIDSVFVPVTLFDEVCVRRTISAGISIICDSEVIPCGPGNIMWHAAKDFLGSDCPEPGVEIVLTKRIPVGAGLGGGSSDAASVLIALQRLGATVASGEPLAAVATRIGADVPFFLVARPSRVRGIGEIVEPLDHAPAATFVIAWPNIAVSTAWAYRELGCTLTSTGAADTIPRFLSGDWPFEGLCNDFEQIVGGVYPKILELKGRLLSLGAEAAMMSGSGSAVFGVFRDPGRADVAARAIQETGIWCKCAESWEGESIPVNGR